MSKNKKRSKKSDESELQKPVESDISLHPSYTNLKLPYAAVCRERYKKAIEKYDKQFKYELKMQEAMQSSAYDAMRFHRHFVITTLWPPLHTKKEIHYTLNNMFKLTYKQEKRLKEIMSQDVV